MRTEDPVSGAAQISQGDQGLLHLLDSFTPAAGAKGVRLICPGGKDGAQRQRCRERQAAPFLKTLHPRVSPPESEDTGKV